jgi:hypothetical protein
MEEKNENVEENNIIEDQPLFGSDEWWEQTNVLLGSNLSSKKISINNILKFQEEKKGFFLN